ncbi:MAG TPA: alpha/beta hydrolase [Ignavibacteriaceae bacterium]|nr:alpha/beta hydrolase [Ignavibacteriaceae bacterium]
MTKRIIITTIIYVLSTTFLCAQNNFQQNNTYESVIVTPDVLYGNKNGTTLTMDVYQPLVQNGAAVLFINSGGFYSPFVPKQYNSNQSLPADNKLNYTFIKKEEFNAPAFMQQFSFQDLLKAGYAVFDIHHSSAPTFKLDEIVVDCELALDSVIKYANSFNIDPNRLGIWGASSGGYLAAYVGFKLHNKIKSIVLYYPAGYDFLKYPNLKLVLPSLKLKDETLKNLSLYNYIASSDPPTLIMYGEQDSAFIKGPSERIFKDLDRLGVKTKLIKYSDVGHIWRGNDGKYNYEISNKAMKELIKWFDKYSK